MPETGQTTFADLVARQGRPAEGEEPSGNAGITAIGTGPIPAGGRPDRQPDVRTVSPEFFG